MIPVSPAPDQGNLPADLVERLHYIELYTARAVKNALMGDSQSRIRGQGFNFDQHKRYQRGDDFRQIDWNVLARLQEVVVKKRLEDKELHTVIVADVSRSMEVTTGGRTKKDLLIEIAATLAFSAAADNIGVGLLGFADRVESFVEPARGRRHAWRVLDHLWMLHPQTVETDLHCPLEFLNARLKRASLIFYVSDFVGRKEVFRSPYLRVLLKKHDVVPLVIEDHLDRFFPGTRGYLELRDPESNRKIRVRTSPENQRRHQSRIQQHRHHLLVSFYQFGLDHLWLRTDEPCLEPILEFFLNRKRRG